MTGYALTFAKFGKTGTGGMGVRGGLELRANLPLTQSEISKGLKLPPQLNP